MEQAVKWYNDLILKKYDENSDFVLFKKAQFVSILSISLGVIMIIFLMSSFFFSSEVFLRAVTASSVLLAVLAATVYMTMSGRAMWAANFLAVSSLIIEIFGFVNRPPHLSGVTLGLFFFQTVAFTTLFCSFSLSLLVLLAILITHACYYFSMSGVVDGLIAETVKMSFTDTCITLPTVYLICLAASRFLGKAIEKSDAESKKNLGHYNNIRNLMDTIRGATELLGNSIHDTSVEIISLSDNAQSQSASVEELSATMEEISAGTSNVGISTREQGESVNELVESIEKLSSLIGMLEQNGKDISKIFYALMEKTSEGQKSTERLDNINKMISANSGEIQAVVNIMTDFFDRINLLSLNAAIEAARAGDHGRGFAVVASEIGKLADNSAKEAERISRLIEKNKADVESGNLVITEIIAFIHSLVAEINSMQEMAGVVIKTINEQKTMKDDMNERTEIVMKKTDQITSAMKEQETAIESVVITIENTSGAIQSIAGSIDNLKISGDGLKKLASDLESRFMDN